MQLGNGKWESTSFNSRLQPTQIALGTVQSGTDKLKLNYSYGTTDNNGNVQSQTITVPTVGTNTGFSAVQTYTYDSLNRLKSATENITPNGGASVQSWKQTFLFDRYGNRNFDTTNNNTTTIPTGCSTAQCNPTVSVSNNRFTSGQGYSYDSAGNVITDALGRTFAFDAENKQKEVRDVNNIVVGTYFYDGDGKRVKKVTNTETVIFVYDAAGKLVAEYANQTPVNPQVSYLTNDNLGSPRITTDANGNVISRRDFHPFGEEIYSAQRTTGLGYTADNVKQKFTGYIRDDETDLDFAEARYYNKQHGRFTAVDPLMASASTGNPQTWNRYIYVGNNPLNITDPTGLSWYFNKDVGDGGSYKWYGDDETVDKGYVSVVGSGGQAGSYVYQSAGGSWISLNMYSNNWKPFDTQADATKNFNGQCANCQGLISSVNEGLDQKIPVVAGAAGGAVLIGTGAGVVMAATGTAAGAAVTTLSLNQAAGAATTVATVAAANPDKTAQVAQSVGATANNIGTYLAGKAPWQVTPGTRILEGQRINDLGRIEPWRAAYDQFGRQIARTDFNAGNRAAGIPPIHHVLYGYNNGVRFTIQNHIPGVFR